MSAQHTLGPVARITLAKAVVQFKAALAAMPVIAKRVDAGQQFNCYEQAGDGYIMHPDDWQYNLCVGPITDAWFVHNVLGERDAALIEAAFKVATEAYRNARLIAAAPEMVEALRAVLPAKLCTTNPNVPDDMDVHLTFSMGELRRIRAILAKIDGEG